MSKSVLLSIKPKYCQLIASGNKTVEVRKTKPKLDTPFKCYIYCTQDFANFATKTKRSEMWIREPLNSVSKGRYLGNGKVIGEFLCDKIDYFSFSESEWAYSVAPAGSIMPMHETTALKIMEEQGCLSLDDINAYFGDEDYTAYFFHISDLVIYDKPKDLDEFMAFGKSNCDCKNCDNCWYMSIDGVCDIKDSYQPLFIPPQSWCYVEELI